MMEAHGTENILFNDVKDEIFDMVKPKDPLKITTNDLIRWLVVIISEYIISSAVAT